MYPEPSFDLNLTQSLMEGIPVHGFHWAALACGKRRASLMLVSLQNTTCRARQTPNSAPHRDGSGRRVIRARSCYGR